jgi:hypothetical protein
MNDLNVVFMLQVLQPKYPDVPDLCDEPDLVHLHPIWRGPLEPGEKGGGGWRRNRGIVRVAILEGI